MSSSAQRLASKVALITGASSGIGRATALLFAREGAKVAATGRNQAALDALVAEIESEGGSAVAISTDITDDAAVKACVEGAVKKFGQLNILVNNAGVLAGGAVGDADMTNFDFNMNVNARAPFCFLMNAVPYLKAAGSDSAVVNVSSVNGLQSFGGTAAYCCSKAAVDMLTRCASVDLAPFGIRVNSVNPGVVATNLQKTGGMTEEAYEGFVKRSVEVTHPLAASLGRVCQPEEVGECVLFLASPQASFVTGTTLTVDGGRGNLGAR